MTPPFPTRLSSDLDALIRRSAMTHRPPPCPVRPPGPRPWRDSLFELADDEVSDLRGDVAACAFWIGHGRSPGGIRKCRRRTRSPAARHPGGADVRPRGRPDTEFPRRPYSRRRQPRPPLPHPRYQSPPDLPDRPPPVP